VSERTSPPFAGMTLNERLVAAGLVERWDAAVRRRDRAAMIAVLKEAGLAEPAPTADAVLADPRRYGF
jgi:hypothetical protein